MKLGSMKIQWVPFIPRWKNNRDLPEEEQVSLEIKRLRPIDELSELSSSELRKWWESRTATWAYHADYSDLIKNATIPSIQMFHRLEQITRNWKGIEVEDESGTWKTLSDVVEISLFFPNPTGTDQSEGLFQEIFEAVREIAHATDDELKNFVAEYGGSFVGNRVPNVPTEESPTIATTQPVQTVPDSSPTVPTENRTSDVQP